MASLDDRLAALAAQDLAAQDLAARDPAGAALDGLEAGVWAKVEERKAAAALGSPGVRVAVTMLALAGGLAFGALHQSRPPQNHVSELAVLSEDGLLAPSVRLGGGA